MSWWCGLHSCTGCRVGLPLRWGGGEEVVSARNNSFNTEMERFRSPRGGCGCPKLHELLSEVHFSGGAAAAVIGSFNCSAELMNRACVELG